MNELEKSYKRVSDLRENYHKNFGTLPEELESFIDALEREIVFLSGMVETMAQYSHTLVRFFHLFLECAPYQTREVQEAREAIAQYMEGIPDRTKH